MVFNSLSIALDRVFTRSLAAVALAAALTGCGAGTKVVSNVAFTNEVVNGDLYAGVDATLAPGSITLPAAVLPLYNPKNPSETLGRIETNGLHIIASVNASAALNLPDAVDGTKLPGGSAIPLVLPAGLKPIAIPAFNSNSLVYLAINGNQIMVGVAVSILKEDGLNIPLGLFLPFTINSQISGTAGFFLGEKQGVAVFALKDAPAAPTLPAVADPSVKTLAAASASRALPAMVGRIEVKSEAISQSTLKQFQKAQKRIGNRAKLD